MYDIHLEKNDIKKMAKGPMSILRELGYFVHRPWCGWDIEHICEINDWPPITHEDVKNIFEMHSILYGGCHGISWGTLRDATGMYLLKQGFIDEYTSPSINVILKQNNPEGLANEELKC